MFVVSSRRAPAASAPAHNLFGPSETEDVDDLFLEAAKTTPEQTAETTPTFRPETEEEDFLFTRTPSTDTDTGTSYTYMFYICKWFLTVVDDCSGGVYEFLNCHCLKCIFSRIFKVYILFALNCLHCEIEMSDAI